MELIKFNTKILGYFFLYAPFNKIFENVSHCKYTVPLKMFKEEAMKKIQSRYLEIKFIFIVIGN